MEWPFAGGSWLDAAGGSPHNQQGCRAVDGGRSMGIVLDVWGRVGSHPVAIMDAEKPWGSWTIALRANMMPGTFSTHVLEEVPSSRRARSMLFMVRWLRSFMKFPSGC